MLAPCGIEIKVGQVWRWRRSKRDETVDMVYADGVVIMEKYNGKRVLCDSKFFTNNRFGYRLEAEK